MAEAVYEIASTIFCLIAIIILFSYLRSVCFQTIQDSIPHSSPILCIPPIVGNGDDSDESIPNQQITDPLLDQLEEDDDYVELSENSEDILAPIVFRQFTHEGFRLLDYSATIKVLIKHQQTTDPNSSNHQLIIGPATELGEYSMTQVDEGFVENFTAFTNWRIENKCLWLLLNLGLINMYHFTMMRKAQRFPPTDVEFFRSFNWKVGFLVFVLRWGIFLVFLYYQSKSDDCVVSINHYFVKLGICFYLLFTRMNAETASITEKILSFSCTFSITLLTEFNYLALLDICLMFFATLRIFTEDFSGAFLEFFGYVCLLNFDYISLEILGPLLLDYQYECKVKILSTFRTTMFFSQTMHTIVVLLFVLLILYSSHLLSPSSWL
jgi:hypothetical protein